MVRALWSRDARLWTGGPEANWLGWLDIVEREMPHVAELEAFGAQVRSLGVAHVVLLGMGGSSLGPAVIADTLGAPGAQFHMLDSTDPAQVLALERVIDLERTLFIVASKSGSTLEPNMFLAYFHARAVQRLGQKAAAARFVAITDPGSSMERLATDEGFGWTFYGDPAIGGRYSVLSRFGLVPAAAIGLDPARLLASAQRMAHSCDASVPPSENPAVRLGLALAALATEGRDKITVIADPAFSSVGAWLEQLIAESTGKRGVGLIPVDGEGLGEPASYGPDRVFVWVRSSPDREAGAGAALDALHAAGHPVIEIALADRWQIGQVFFLWEMATACAGAQLRIDPFDQPDVEASKVKTRALTTAFAQTGALPAEAPFFRTDGVALFTDEANRKALGPCDSLEGILRAHLHRLGAGDYAALLAYLEQNAAHTERLQAIREAVRARFKVATSVGFGPRFLHSTGQAYKGGPNTGVFLHITATARDPVPIPGQAFSFGVIQAAQAQGDFEVLLERQRRALRVHLEEPIQGLDQLLAAVRRALQG
jgi:transaldolase/glucose-6-phosphate isomerase